MKNTRVMMRNDNYRMVERIRRGAYSGIWRMYTVIDNKTNEQVGEVWSKQDNYAQRLNNLAAKFGFNASHIQ